MSYCVMISSTEVSGGTVPEPNEVTDVLLDWLCMYLVAEPGLEELVFASDVCVLSESGVDGRARFR